jgi:Zn-dependent M16 (insulinase) family peptidase
MLDTWLYGGDPAEALLAEDVLSSLEKKLETGYFEDLLKRLFLDQSHTALVVLVPSRTLGEEKRAEEEARVKAAAARWTEADVERLKAEAKSLAEWQQTPDSAEALATIPMLRLSDLKEEPEPLPVTVGSLGSNVLLGHGVPRELTYLNLHFNAAALTPEELPALSLLTELLGRLETARRSAADLQTEVKRVIGKFGVTASVYPGTDEKTAKVIVSARSAFLPKEAEDAAALLAEILTQTTFTDTAVLS